MDHNLTHMRTAHTRAHTWSSLPSLSAWTCCGRGNMRAAGEMWKEDWLLPRVRAWDRLLVRRGIEPLNEALLKLVRGDGFREVEVSGGTDRVGTLCTISTGVMGRADPFADVGDWHWELGCCLCTSKLSSHPRSAWNRVRDFPHSA